MNTPRNAVPASSTAGLWRRVTTALAGATVLLVAACSSSSSPGSTEKAGAVSPATVSAAASTGGNETSSDGSTAPTSAESTADATTSSSAAPSAGGAKQALAPCELVTGKLLTDTLGTKAIKGIFEPLTTAGTGCRFTKVDAKSSVNILAEVTLDAANYLPELAYTPPAGSSPIPGADRGFVKPPAAGASTSSIMLVKGTTGVFVTIFQDSPPVTAASLQKLASAVLGRL